MPNKHIRKIFEIVTVEREDELKEVVLYTDISPEFTQEREKTINECFREEIAKADRVEISVAYCAGDALQELDRLVEEEKIKHICLILGMYFFFGFAKRLHKLVMKINARWVKKGIGEIRLMHSFTNHEKLYCFYKDNQIFSAIQGSPNLSFLITKKNKKPRHNELAWLSNIPTTLEKSQKYMERLKLEVFSDNVFALEKYRSVKAGEIKVRKRGAKVTYKKPS